MTIWRGLLIVACVVVLNRVMASIARREAQERENDKRR